MTTTTVTVQQTAIKYVDIETEEISSIIVSGKKTVKESKELIPENSVLVTKITTKETFEVPTEELMNLRIEATQN